MSTMDNGVTQISIHALLAESDVHHKQHITPHNVFLSTLSLRRATSALQSLAGPGRYFYPRSPCGERPPRMISSIRSISISIHALLAESDALLCNNPGSCLISIHALLAESDLQRLTVKTQAAEISIHALLAESDQQSRGSYIRTEKFLSTLSLRRATVQHRLRLVLQKISIHALLAESDQKQTALLML